MQGDDNNPVQKHTYMLITLSILRIVLQQTFTVCASEYLAYLFKAMCTTAFFAFLRLNLEGQARSGHQTTPSSHLHSLLLISEKINLGFSSAYKTVGY